jgi:hypothetical protein
MIVLGVIALVVCIPLLIGGVALAAIFGPDGTFETGNERIDTATRGLVSAVAEISSDAPVDRGDITLKLQLTSASDQALFVGVGPAADVSTYLGGVNVERIDDFEFGPFRYSKTEQAGERVPDPPGAQTFWVARAEGTGEQQLSWDLRSGTYQVVVMNADGAPGVDVTGKIGVGISWIFPVAIALLIVGALLLVGGILLVVFGAKRRRLPEGQYGVPPIGYSPYPGQPGYQPGYQPGAGQALGQAPGQAAPPWTPPPAAPAPPPTAPTPPPLKPGDPLPPPPPPSP